MRPGTDVMADLVLLGAGHAHVEVLRRFAHRPDPRLRLTLIAREPSTPYSGRLPALIRGECAPEEAHIDLGPLAAAAGARMVIAEATAIDLAARQIAVRRRPAIRFDFLSIDIGGIPVMPDGGGIAVKPIGGFLAALARLESELADGARIALVGGGAAGTELALALARRFARSVGFAGSGGFAGRQRPAGQPRITLVCDTADPLPLAPPRARAVARAALAEARVELVCGVRAGAQADGRLALSDGSFLAVEAVLWATDIVGPPLLAESGLICDAAGCVLVDASLRSRGHDFVFAAGDCAAIATAPRPKAGVWAVRAGPRLARNLRRVARGLRPRAWRAQATALAIVGLGHGRAVAWRNGVAVAGRLVARYKDWLDGRFMRRYARTGLPRRAILALGTVRAEGVAVNLDPADLAVLSGPSVPPAHGAAPSHAGPGFPASTGSSAGAGSIATGLTQQATNLPALLNDPYDFGRIAAAHALVRLHAANARPWTAVAIVTPRAAPHDQARADVMALLQGAAEVLAADGAALVDCATATGSEAGLSLVLTGQAAPASGEEASLHPGDALILTKPLGSGIILEANRRGLAEARWLLGALEVMTASSATAADILRQHGAATCAVVAEHGVVGTLSALLRDANLAAGLFPDAIPALQGARELAHQGIEQTASTENRQAWPDPPDWADLALLTDPQIAGGLLAGVPEAWAETCLAALHAAGCAASCIGQAETRRLDVPRLWLHTVPPDGAPGTDSEAAS
ncbi:MAG TPA: FAD-dependent oxidoreductase [Acetobacteraceae bacterium]|jgi:selenide,water dikinase|nr:FAD-dependent oxidoreductase [Acetobacteraceae bacterium]